MALGWTIHHHAHLTLSQCVVHLDIVPRSNRSARFGISPPWSQFSGGNGAQPGSGTIIPRWTLHAISQERQACSKWTRAALASTLAKPLHLQCKNCHASRKPCDRGRPCGRCVDRGEENLSVDRPRRRSKPSPQSTSDVAAAESESFTPQERHAHPAFCASSQYRSADVHHEIGPDDERFPPALDPSASPFYMDAGIGSVHGELTEVVSRGDPWQCSDIAFGQCVP